MKDFISFFFKGLYLFFIDVNFRTFVKLFFMNGGKKRYTEYVVKANRYKICVADMKSFIWQYQEIFAYNFYAFNTVLESPVIYDCGANIGTSVLFFSKNYPKAKIIAFEASPYIFSILKRNVEINKITNVTAHQNAVWIKDETLEFGEEGADSGSIHSRADVKKVKVQALDFLKILENEKRIDLLKIDIEGAEMQLLPHISPIFHKVEKIFIEYHSFNDQEQKLDELLSLLSKNDFRYYIRHGNDRKKPFIDIAREKEMDMQLNIFAYKRARE